MIVIIGASSFIGVYTADACIKQGYEIIATGRNDRFREHYANLGVEYVNLDLTVKNDFEKLPKQGVTAVILLGGLLPANCGIDPKNDENAMDYFAVNTLGTINVLEYCRK